MGRITAVRVLSVVQRIRMPPLKILLRFWPRALNVDTWRWNRPLTEIHRTPRYMPAPRQTKTSMKLVSAVSEELLCLTGEEYFYYYNDILFLVLYFTQHWYTTKFRRYSFIHNHSIRGRNTQRLISIPPQFTSIPPPHLQSLSLKPGG